MQQIRPQPGPQEKFLSTPADIAVYGGAAGGGKTFALLLEPLRHKEKKGFGAVTFRRTTPQIRSEGGLWDESGKIYPLLGGVPNESYLTWTFPTGVKFKFAHLEHEKNVYDWQGAQIAYIGFDELTHFTEKQFFYMLSRNRSTCGVRPYIRATTNPDADSWVAELIDWWIREDGFAIPERSGVIRWFIRLENELIWADTKEELIKEYPDSLPKSFTFIPAKLSDNPILEQKDPGYRANLMAQNRVDRARLLEGNWKIKEVAGELFDSTWFEIVERAPKLKRKIRHWDLASTEKKKERKSHDPDWTVGCLLGELNGVYYVLDIIRFRKKPAGVEAAIKQTAEIDGRDVEISMEQEPGSSGVNTIDHYARNILKGYTFNGLRTTGSKIERAKPVSAAAEQGNVKIVRGEWNRTFLYELEQFPSDDVHDDQVDSLSGAYEQLILKASVPDDWNFF